MSMLHVRIDGQIQSQAAEALADLGLTISDAVHMLLERVVEEGALPSGLEIDRDGHDAWFRKKVQQALHDDRTTIPHAEVMRVTQTLIDSKRLCRSKA